MCKWMAAMKTASTVRHRWSAMSLAVVPLCGVRIAQAANESPGGPIDGPRLEEIVVTANTGRLSKLRSSVSVSTLDAARLQESVPGNAADILRNVPGILSQASGGEGNANISARGLPQ